MREAKITQRHGVFSLTCSVVVPIRATPERVWRIMTDLSSVPRWNSTVSAIEGEIREGGKLRLRVPGTDRTFSPTVSGVVLAERMTWTGGFAPLFRGVRTFQLTALSDGETAFAMAERFSGLMLPLLRKSLPDFGPIFERYANDLKQAAERVAACV